MSKPRKFKLMPVARGAPLNPPLRSLVARQVGMRACAPDTVLHKYLGVTRRPVSRLKYPREIIVAPRKSHVEARNDRMHAMFERAPIEKAKHALVVCEQIHALLDRKEWSADTLSTIGLILSASGWPIYAQLSSGEKDWP
jgi:hypothetical protein